MRLRSRAMLSARICSWLARQMGSSHWMKFRQSKFSDMDDGLGDQALTICQCTRHVGMMLPRNARAVSRLPSPVSTTRLENQNRGIVTRSHCYASTRRCRRISPASNPTSLLTSSIVGFPVPLYPPPSHSFPQINNVHSYCPSLHLVQPASSR